MMQFQAMIDGVRTLKNNTLKISLETQDIQLFKPEEISKIFQMNDKVFWTAWSEQPVKQEDIKVEEIEFQNDKSPSKRLRDRMYVYWKSKYGSGDFDGWRKAEMDRIGSKYLDEVKD